MECQIEAGASSLRCAKTRQLRSVVEMTGPWQGDAGGRPGQAASAELPTYPDAAVFRCQPHRNANAMGE